ncbi:MAG: GAP family protein [Mycobacterium sp.]
MYSHLFPAALIVALSPMSILPPILVLLYSDRPRTAGVTYLMGWLVGISVVLSVVVTIGAHGQQSHAAAAGTQSRLQIGIGLALIALAVLTWLRRDKHANALSALDRLQNASPWATALIGFVLAVANPKFILACVAGGVAINAYASSPLETAAGIGCFVVVAGSTTAAPILLQLVAARYADSWLEGMRHWVHRHTAALTAGSLLFVGILLILVSLGTH